MHVYVCVDRDGDRQGRDDPVSTLDSREPFSTLPLDLVLPTTSLKCSLSRAHGKRRCFDLTIRFCFHPPVLALRSDRFLENVAGSCSMWAPIMQQEEDPDSVTGGFREY